MKYSYHVLINTPPESTQEFSYTYAKTKNIEISVTETGARITADIGKDYSQEWGESYAQKLVQDGIRRCALLYLMRYNQTMPIKSVMIFLYAKGKIVNYFDVTDSIKLYSLIEGRLHKTVPSNLLRKDILAAITHEMKKDYGNRAAALYAYLISKSKQYEAEKFIYLWMSFNGVYGYWGHEAGVGNEDKSAIEVLLKKYGWGKEILTRKKRSEVGKKVSLIIHSNDTILSREVLEKADEEEIQEKICSLPEIKNTGITLYGYLLCDFCYFLRCSMIHANKPVPLFGFENDLDIRVIITANAILEDFLDNHLYECFEERN